MTKKPQKVEVRWHLRRHPTKYGRIGKSGMIKVKSYKRAKRGTKQGGESGQRNA